MGGTKVGAPIIITSKLIYLDKNSVTSLSGPSLLVRNSNVSFCKTLGGLRSPTRVKVFCRFKGEFR